MANTTLTQTGAQVQAILDKADKLPSSLGTAGQVLTMNSGATAPEWQTPSGGGASIGGGYTFDVTCDETSNMTALVMGTYNGSFGWHLLSGNELSISITNASMLVIVDYDAGGRAPLIQITGNTNMRFADGTAVNASYNTFTNLFNKLIYLKGNASIYGTDDE